MTSSVTVCPSCKRPHGEGCPHFPGPMFPEECALKWLIDTVQEESRPRPVNIDAILEERGTTHGDYTVHAFITQSFKRVMVETPNWSKLHDHEKETLEMLAHKVGRILGGNPHYPDHWLDISGYAKLSADRNKDEEMS